MSITAVLVFQGRGRGEREKSFTELSDTNMLEQKPTPEPPSHRCAEFHQIPLSLSPSLHSLGQAVYLGQAASLSDAGDNILLAGMVCWG